MNNDKTQTSIELSRLIERQTKFFERSDPSPIELEEFEWVGQRIRKLFAELAQKKAA
jgi:hypothetical protein